MASWSEVNLSCPVCSDIFKDPVSLSCKHSFCEDCLQSSWADANNFECPVCKRRSSKEKLYVNFLLSQQCKELRLERDAAAESKQLCSAHSEDLDTFCLDDLQLVCSAGKDSGTHHSHNLQAVEEAAEQHKKKLESLIKPLRKKIRLIQEVKRNCHQTDEHIEIQAENTEERIKAEFRKLHQFIEEEEQLRLAELRMEKKEKSQMMKEKIGALSREATALHQLIKATEAELRAKDSSFLQNYKATVERVQSCSLPGDPELLPGALINVARHLGNLSFQVWNKMKEMVSYSPVILDPNTAHPELHLSDDLTCATRGEKTLDLPNNPERVDHFVSAVASEGFTSGSHSWEVEVGDNSAFVLGVIPESIQRKGVLSGVLWRLMHCDDAYKVLSPSDMGSDVLLPNKPRRIKVHLDCDQGRLSFSDADSHTHIHTFTHAFTDRLFPYFSTWSETPLKITKLEISVAVEQQQLQMKHE